MDADLTRAINLVEILKEELEDSSKPLPPDLTDQQLQSMTLDAIRQYYNPSSNPSTQTAAAVTLHPTTSQNPQQLSQEQIEQLKLRFPAQNHTAVFKSYFPSLFASRTAAAPPAQPTAVVLCFHSSGNAEDMYSSEGTGSRRVQSALLEACKAHDWLLLAPQLPGRGQRMREQPINTLQDVAGELLPLVVPALLSTGGKFAVVGHSLGCWTAYELLLALKTAGLPDPAVVCFSAMPWPHIPMDQRPWRQQKTLNEDQFKEECRGWDINEAVFSPGMWEMYQPMLRADFKLFDEYIPSNTQQAAVAAPFASRLRLFWGQRDRRVTEAMVKGWLGYTTEPSKACISCVAGGHLWPIAEPAAKSHWLSAVAEALQDALLC